MKADKATNRITTNLTDEQKEKLLEICAMSNKTAGLFIRESLIIPLIENQEIQSIVKREVQPIVVNTPQPTEDALKAIQAASGNLNQLMRELNTARLENEIPDDYEAKVDKIMVQANIIRNRCSKMHSFLKGDVNPINWVGQKALQLMNVKQIEKLLEMKKAQEAK